MVQPDASSLHEPIVIRRERDAALVNRITNDPVVLPFISRHGREIDWDPAVRGCCILSNGEDAAAVFGEETVARAWQMTTIFGPTCRGRRAIETGKAMRDWMIPKYADVLFGSIPNAYRHAMWFYHKMGARRMESFEFGGETFLPQKNEALFVLQAA